MMNDPMMGAAPPMPQGDPMMDMGGQDPSSMALAAAEVTLEMLPMLPDAALQSLAGAASQELQGRAGDGQMADPMMAAAPPPPPPAMADPMMGGAPPMPQGDPMMGGIGALAG